MIRELPFRAEFLPLLRDGRKTATARTTRYGVRGDVLAVPGASDLRLVLTTEPIQLQLQEIAEKWWREEGTSGPEDFQRVWCEIHPRAGWTPSRLVWFHRFQPVRLAGGLTFHAAPPKGEAAGADAMRMLPARASSPAGVGVPTADRTRGPAHPAAEPGTGPAVERETTTVHLRPGPGVASDVLRIHMKQGGGAR